MAFDDKDGLRAMAENVPDGRPVFPLVERDRFFDEGSPSEAGPLTGLIGWSVQASRMQRGGLLRLVQWMQVATDAERRVILILFERFQGRVPCGAVKEISSLADTSGETVRVAMKRFTSFFPDAISPLRRRCD